MPALPRVLSRELRFRPRLCDDAVADARRELFGRRVAAHSNDAPDGASNGNRIADRGHGTSFSRNFELAPNFAAGAGCSVCPCPAR